MPHEAQPSTPATSGAFALPKVPHPSADPPASPAAIPTPCPEDRPPYYSPWLGSAASLCWLCALQLHIHSPTHTQFSQHFHSQQTYSATQNTKFSHKTKNQNPRSAVDGDDDDDDDDDFLNSSSTTTYIAQTIRLHHPHAKPPLGSTKSNFTPIALPSNQLQTQCTPQKKKSTIPPSPPNLPTIRIPPPKDAKHTSDIGKHHNT